MWRNPFPPKEFPIIFSFERDVLRNLADENNLKINVPIGEFWVEKKKKTVIILGYLFANQICPFYSEKQFRCTIYNQRPAICRMFPIVSIVTDPDKGPQVKVDVVNCPSAKQIFRTSNEEVVCPKGSSFATIFGPYFIDARFTDVYTTSAVLYMYRLRKRKEISLQPFRLAKVKKVLKSKKYEKLTFEQFYEKNEKEKFRPFVKSLFFI